MTLWTVARQAPLSPGAGPLKAHRARSPCTDPSSMPRSKEHSPALSLRPRCHPLLAQPCVACTISWQGVRAAAQDCPRTGPADPPEPGCPGLAEPSILTTLAPEPALGPAAACNQVSLLNEDERSLERTLHTQPTAAATPASSAGSGPAQDLLADGRASIPRGAGAAAPPGLLLPAQPECGLLLPAARGNPSASAPSHPHPNPSPQHPDPSPHQPDPLHPHRPLTPAS